MEHTFEKESILIEWVPIALLSSLSLMFVIFAISSNKVFMIVGSILFAILFAIFPLMTFRYIKSFSDVKVTGNTIKINHKNGMFEFIIPHDLGRVKIDANDLQIELKKNGQRFVLRSHFLKNKTTFHELFDQMIKDHPPSKDKVILKASVLEIMDRLKIK
jgi:hypothetical protein